MTRVLTTLIAVTAAAGFAFAQPMPGGPMAPAGAPAPAPAPAMAPCAGMGMSGMPMMPGMPDLTNEQQDKVDVAMQNHIRAMAPIETDIRIKEMDLAALWRADNPDSKKIVAKVREIGALRIQAEVERVNNMLAMREILTPEQRKSFHPGMGGRRGMGPGGRMGQMRQGGGMKGRGMGRMMGTGSGACGDCNGNCQSD